MGQMLWLFSAQQSLVVGARAPVRSAVSMAGTIPEELAKLQGPEIFWGSEGAEMGYEESDIKGYDNFGKLCAAIDSFGLKDTLGRRVHAPRAVGLGVREARDERRHAAHGRHPQVPRHRGQGHAGLDRGQPEVPRRRALLPPLRAQDVARRRDHRPQVGGPVEVVELAVGRRVLERPHPGVDTVLVPGRFEAPPPDAY